MELITSAFAPKTAGNNLGGRMRPLAQGKGCSYRTDPAQNMRKCYLDLFCRVTFRGRSRFDDVPECQLQIDKTDIYINMYIYIYMNNQYDNIS